MLYRSNEVVILLLKGNGAYPLYWQADVVVQPEKAGILHYFGSAEGFDRMHRVAEPTMIDAPRMTAPEPLRAELHQRWLRTRSSGIRWAHYAEALGALLESRRKFLLIAALFRHRRF